MKTEIKCPLCGDSMVRPKLNPCCLTHQHQTQCPFVWNDLTEEQMKVLFDAALGRAVRRMPEGSQIMRSYDGSFYAGKYSGLPLQGVSPEAAMKAAGLMEGEEK